MNGKQKTEGVGWASEKWTEQKIAALLFEIKENIRLGRHPQTLAEMRDMNEKANTEANEIKQEQLSETITLREIFDRFIAVYKTETVEKTSKRVNELYLKWIDPPLGASRLIDIKVEDIQSIIIVASETLSPRSVNYIKSTIQILFNYAKKNDLYFKDNPATKVKVKLKDNKRNRFLTKDEAHILLLSLYAGLRAGEIFNLTWERVLWNIDMISIADPKNGEGRMEPMHIVVKDMLKRRHKSDSIGYVFKSREGGKIKDISNAFQRAVERLGLNESITDSRQKVVFHTLRHTYASWLVMAGVDLYTTQKLMGHKNSQMTQRYAHLAPEHLGKAVNLLESV